jgi:hypothetical protein
MFMICSELTIVKPHAKRKAMTQRKTMRPRQVSRGVKPPGDSVGVWRLNAEQSKAFVQALKEPAEPNAALKAAAKRYRALVRRSD